MLNAMGEEIKFDFNGKFPAIRGCGVRDSKPNKQEQIILGADLHPDDKSKWKVVDVNDKPAIEQYESDCSRKLGYNVKISSGTEYAQDYKHTEKQAKEKRDQEDAKWLDGWHTDRKQDEYKTERAKLQNQSNVTNAQEITIN